MRHKILNFDINVIPDANAASILGSGITKCLKHVGMDILGKERNK